MRSKQIAERRPSGPMYAMRWRAASMKHPMKDWEPASKSGADRVRDIAQLTEEKRSAGARPRRPPG